MVLFPSLLDTHRLSHMPVSPVASLLTPFLSAVGGEVRRPELCPCNSAPYLVV